MTETPRWTYLLVNHVPLCRGDAPGAYRILDLFLEDMIAQAQAIRAAGGRLVLASPCRDSMPSDADHFTTIRPTGGAESDVPFEYAPLPFFNSLATYLRARRDLRSRLDDLCGRADFVQGDTGGHPFSLGLSASTFARRRGRPFVWIFDGADPFPRFEAAAGADRNVLRRTLRTFFIFLVKRRFLQATRAADLVFVHNDAVRQRYARQWDRRWHFFPRSFVRSGMILTREAQAEKAAALGRSGNVLRLVTTSQLIPMKAVDHVLRATRLALDAGAKVELDVIGQGPQMPALRKLSDDLRLAPHVRFRGRVPYGPPLFDLWKTADVAIVTNLTAEISRNVLLFMSQGLPLLIYENPGTDHLIRESGAGVLVPKSDVDALARAIVEADRHRAPLQTMAERGIGFSGRHTLEETHRRRAELTAGLAR